MAALHSHRRAFLPCRRDNMAAPVVWDEQQAYEELLYWDRLLQEGHRLLPHDFDRYAQGFPLVSAGWERCFKTV